jgi:hypothetical protein
MRVRRSIGGHRLAPRPKSCSDYKLLKRLAAEDSQRDARNFVHKHKDLVLGASMDEEERAIQKIAAALLELRIAKIDAEIAKHVAVTELSAEAE